MRTLHTVVAVAVLATIAAAEVVGANAPNSRPPGVSAAEWAPISDTLGVVLDQAMPAAGDPVQPAQPNAVDQSQRLSRTGGDQAGTGGVGGAILIPPISGYLMLRRGDQWQRVILIEPVKGPGVAG